MSAVCASPVVATDPPQIVSGLDMPTASVLLISDSAADHKAIRDVFRGVGWRIHCATSAAGAYSLIEREAVQVILCDDMVDNRAWRDVLQATRFGSGAPEFVLVCTGVDARVWPEALSTGARDVLIRPFEFSEVMHAVRLAWFAWTRRQAATVAAKAVAAL